MRVRSTEIVRDKDAGARNSKREGTLEPCCSGPSPVKSLFVDDYLDLIGVEVKAQPPVTNPSFIFTPG